MFFQGAGGIPFMFAGGGMPGGMPFGGMGHDDDEDEGPRKEVRSDVQRERTRAHSEQRRASVAAGTPPADASDMALLGQHTAAWTLRGCRG